MIRTPAAPEEAQSSRPHKMPLGDIQCEDYAQLRMPCPAPETQSLPGVLATTVEGLTSHVHYVI